MSTCLVDKIFQSIHEDIISWKLQPGQRLHIAHLAEVYQVGPGPIREALCRLLTTDLVVCLNQRGFRVAAVSQADLQDIYQTRAHIEATALKLSIEKGGDTWEADVIASYHCFAKYEQEKTIQTPADYQQWEERHHQFNLSLIKACGLSYLLSAQQHLYHLTERYRRQWLMAGIENSKKLIYAKKQKDVMDAALARDAKTATALLFKHYAAAVAVIGAYFEKENSVKGVHS